VPVLPQQRGQFCQSNSQCNLHEPNQLEDLEPGQSHQCCPSKGASFAKATANATTMNPINQKTWSLASEPNQPEDSEPDQSCQCCCPRQRSNCGSCCDCLEIVERKKKPSERLFLGTNGFWKQEHCSGLGTSHCRLGHVAAGHAKI